MNDLLQSPVFWICLTAASEIIGMNHKCKENSVIEVVLKAVLSLKPKSMK